MGENNFQYHRYIFLSKITHYIILRYTSYFLQFIIVLYAAKNLGPYYLGVYSFLIMILQYFSYSNFGIQYSMNFFITTKTSLKLRELIFSTSLFLSIVSSIIFLFLFPFLNLFKIEIFTKYNLQNYYPIIGFIVAFQNLNQLYLNVYRTFGKLLNINIFQIIIPLLQIFGLLLYNQESLLTYFIWSILIGNLFSLILFIKTNPIKTVFKFTSRIAYPLFKKGVNLLMYNISFYLILLSGSTMVSIFYSIENLGNYNLGNSLSNAVMMLMGSVSFLLFSKLISKIGEAKDKNDIIYILEKSRKIYLITTILFALLFFNIIPYIEIYLLEYRDAFKVFKLMLLAQILLSFSFGYSSLLIAKKKEISLTINALISIIVNIIISFICGYYNFSYIIIGWSSILAMLIFSLKTIYDGNKFTTQYLGLFEILKGYFSKRYFLPIIFLFLSILFERPILGLVSLFLYIILNYKEINYTFKHILNILKNSNKFLDINE